MMILVVLIVVTALVLLVESAFTIYTSLYTWSDPARFAGSLPPLGERRPTLSFSLIVPARDEASVIGETMRQIADLDYPRHLFEIIVICESRDLPTINAVERQIRLLAGQRVRLLEYEGPPTNKPRALNLGMREAIGDVVGVFDAEDEPDPEILQTVNTVMLDEKVRVVQSGVQLMNLSSRWFSALNVLEYFFWFKSRLHFFSRHDVIPLGGNTVFLERRLLERLGGWDETCLTEDAEIGIRLSAQRERIRIVYDDRRVTREETPPTVAALMRQRTRWSQGFLQIVASGLWLQLPGWHRRLLALHTLLFPLFQAATVVLLPLALLAAVVVHSATLIAMLAIAPLYLTGVLVVINAIALLEFAEVHGLRRPWREVLLLPPVWLGHRVRRPACRDTPICRHSKLGEDATYGQTSSCGSDQGGRECWRQSDWNGTHRWGLVGSPARFARRAGD